MDAGVASEDNVQWLRGHKYRYIVVSRKKKTEIPDNVKMIPVKSDYKTKAVLVQAGLAGNEETDELELYCHSIAKEKKEEGIKNTFQERFEAELLKADKALNQKSGTKRYEKVIERIGRLKEKFKRVSHLYNITIQKDDGSGKDNVNNYAIYRNSSFESNGTGYEFLDEIPNGTNHYIDIGAGDGDPSNYFYYIQTNGTSGEVTKNDTQVGKFVKEMKYSIDAPRQLISIPLEQSDTDISTVLQTIQGSYDHAQWYDPLDTEDHWKTNTTFKPKDFDDLFNVHHKMALWITMTSSDNLTIAGKVPEQTSIQLYEGWNFVSYASFINRTVENALSGIPYEKVEGFEENNPPYYLKTLIASDWMKAGNGYWIRIAEDCEWVITNH